MKTMATVGRWWLWLCRGLSYASNFFSWASLLLPSIVPILLPSFCLLNPVSPILSPLLPSAAYDVARRFFPHGLFIQAVCASALTRGCIPVLVSTLGVRGTSVECIQWHRHWLKGWILPDTTPLESINIILNFQKKTTVVIKYPMMGRVSWDN